MPDPRHQSRSQNHPNQDRRDWNREREPRDERRNHYEEERERNTRNNQTRLYRHPKSPAYSADESVYDHQTTNTDTSVYESRGEALYNLRYLPTSRGICQIMEFALNLLLVICAGVPYSNKGQYQDIANLGGLYYYYYGGAQAFSPEDAAKVKQLDERFYQLKIPPYIYTMACGGALMVYALAMLALGLFRVPYRWPLVLLVEALLDGLIGLGYIPAVAFFFIKVQEVYSSAVCKDREEMYNSKNLKGFECSLTGTDIAAGIFGVLGVFVFCISAVLAVRAFRAVRKLKQQREAEDGNL